MVLTVQTSSKPAVTITRTATRAKELVYIAVANKAIKYPHGSSRIVYIGTTQNGADRIAASAAAKAKQLLGLHGVKQLEFFVVTNTSMASVKTWHKLERGLILSFKDTYGEPPKCNIVGRNMQWRDELDYFTVGRLAGVIKQYSDNP